MDQTYMKERPVLGLVVRMSLPMVVSMLVNSLYNIIDSFFVAKISEDAMTALSLVYPVQNLVNAVSVGFGIGTVSYTHLDVYKRQIVFTSRFISCIRKSSLRPAGSSLAMISSNSSK